MGKLNSSDWLLFFLVALLGGLSLSFIVVLTEDAKKMKAEITHLQSEIEARDKALDELSKLVDSLDVSNKESANQAQNQLGVNRVLLEQLTEYQKETDYQRSRADFFQSAAEFQEEPRFFNPMIRFTGWGKSQKIEL